MTEDLIKAKHIHKRKIHPLSERMLHKDYDRKGCSKKKDSGRDLQEARRQKQLIGGKPPVIK
jgi:hypothetical protein